MEETKQRRMSVTEQLGGCLLTILLMFIWIFIVDSVMQSNSTFNYLLNLYGYSANQVFNSNGVTINLQLYQYVDGFIFQLSEWMNFGLFPFVFTLSYFIVSYNSNDRWTRDATILFLKSSLAGYLIWLLVDLATVYYKVQLYSFFHLTIKAFIFMITGLTLQLIICGLFYFTNPKYRKMPDKQENP